MQPRRLLLVRHAKAADGAVDADRPLTTRGEKRAAAIGASGGALYQQAGLIEVPTVAAMLDTARVLATQPVMRGPNVALLANAGSPATLSRPSRSKSISAWRSGEGRPPPLAAMSSRPWKSIGAN